MNIDEAKEILESIGLLDSITDELIEASGMVLDELEKRTTLTTSRPAAIMPDDLQPMSTIPTLTSQEIDAAFRRLREQHFTASSNAQASNPFEYVSNHAWPASHDEIIPESPMDWEESDED